MNHNEGFSAKNLLTKCLLTVINTIKVYMF